jgi:hypothetical protein
VKIGEVEILPVLDGVFRTRRGVHLPGAVTWADIPGFLNGNCNCNGEIPYGGFLLRSPGEYVVLYGAGPRFPVIPGVKSGLRQSRLSAGSD